MSATAQNGTLRIGPAGNSTTFYESGHAHTYEAPAWLKAIGLNAFEYSFGRGVNLSAATAQKIAREAESNGISMSVHAPYYTNLANPDPAMIDNTFGYIERSIAAARQMGAVRAVFHPGAQGKSDRAEAFAVMRDNMLRLLDRLNGQGMLDDFILCPETLGKKRQMGTVEEVIALCKPDGQVFPCFDFGHINSYTGGGLNDADAFRRIIDYTAKELGDYKTKNMHIHFSKIMYGAQGEIKHLTFADTEYGPMYEHLCEVVREYALTPVIICESKDTMSDDALIIKNYHENI